VVLGSRGEESIGGASDIGGEKAMNGHPSMASSSRARRRSLIVFGCSLLAILSLAAAAVGWEAWRPGPEAGQSAAPVPSTALVVTAVGPPQHALGTDGREHIDYDLVITNAFTADVTLRSLEVTDGRGERLLRLEGEALEAVTFELWSRGGAPTLTVPRSGVVATVVDIAVAPGAVPTRLTHRISYEVPPDAPGRAAIESLEVTGPELPVAKRGPIVTAPPLEGPGWMAVNACCNSPSAHRNFILAASDRFAAPEIFAIDWIRLRDGRMYEGNGSQTTQFHAEGAPILAVADGTVVRAVDGRPEFAPAPFGRATFSTADEAAGNYVIVRMRPRVFALYAHMRPGTVRVTVGQRVRTGQRLGELGNSGNSDFPHLHFGLLDGPSPATSQSLPFEFDRFRFAGVGEFQEGAPGQATLAPEVPVTGTPSLMRRTYPLTNAVVDFRSDTAPGR
jgi:hypothetical protein